MHHHRHPAPHSYSWLPVLSNIAPPHVHHGESTGGLVEKLCSSPDLPLYMDIFSHPKAQFMSRHPLWSQLPDRKLSAATLWHNEWLAKDVWNIFACRWSNHLTTCIWPSMSALDSAEQVPNWPRNTRSQPLRLGLHDGPRCQCRCRQSIAHVVNECQLTRLHGRLGALHSADETAVGWLGKHCKC